MAMHDFGIMENDPVLTERYDEYTPRKYNCISVDDEYIESICSELESLTFYWNTLSVKGKGLSYSGVTLIPPSLLDKFIEITEINSNLSQLNQLLKKAQKDNKWIIHYGI